ncbi:MAG: DmsE family decaheme c-type cytochrome [Acidobacteriia bacterium]|nr:DmsE family decaheme c-type cytochrome [Terriglobia bacterium]
MKKRFGMGRWLVLPTLLLPAWAANTSQPPRPPMATAAEYAGSDVCLTCHEDVYKKQFEGTPHFQTTKKNGHGCESCHGPGSEHVAGGGDKAKIVRFSELSRQAASQRCLECHGEDVAQRHSGSSAHLSNDVGCIDCHSPHHAKEAQHLLAKKQPELCYGCHASARAEFARPYRHRVNEGLVQCSDCHDLHGATTLRQVKNVASGDAACFRCHIDKQGPYVYEHMPVKTEGCSSCHTPHGSTNARLLKISQVNLLCLQCHSFPGAGPIGPAHNLSQKYQACTMCHPMIHGSNTNVAFMQ